MNKILKEVIWASIFGIVVTAIVIFGGIAGYFITEQYDLYNKVNFNNEEGIKNINQTNITEIIDGCIHLKRIDKKLDCVKTHVKRFYHYEIRNDSQDVSFKVLMEDGGDCRNWAQFWDYVAGEMDLNKESIRINVDKNTAHRFSIYYNHQGYCLVDQLRLECTIYA